MKSRDLLVIAHSYYPWDPRIRKQVTAALDAGLTVDVVCLRDAGEPARSEQGALRVRRLAIRRDRGRGVAGYAFEYLSFGVLAFFVASALFVRHRHRVVQAHNIPDELVFAALLPRLAGAHVVLDIHDFMPELFATRYGLADEHAVVRLLRMMEQWSCALAQTVIVTHERGRRRLLERGVAPEKLVVVMNTAPMPDAPPVRTRSDRFRVLYHGILSDVYDLETAVRAIGLLRDQGVTDVELWLVGDGPRRNRLRTLIDELGLGAQVRLDGAIAAEQVPALIEQADAGFAVLADGEHQQIALPTKMFEVVAHGLPVVTSRTLVIGDHFDESAALFVKAGDAPALAGAMRRLRDDAGYARSLAEGAWRATWPIRWQEMARRYVELVARRGAER
ncbi:MAG TPA: glycosyltransferase [Longimicrobiales bacterium]